MYENQMVKAISNRQVLSACGKVVRQPTSLTDSERLFQTSSSQGTAAKLSSCMTNNGGSGQ